MFILISLAILSISGFFICFIAELLRPEVRTHNGYIIVPNEKGDLIFEHRVVAEKSLGRRLYHNEVVHHINGCKTDNRLINLCVMDKKQHDKWHDRLNWIKDKYGRYPRVIKQRKKLEEEFKGILL